MFIGLFGLNFNLNFFGGGSNSDSASAISDGSPAPYTRGMITPDDLSLPEFDSAEAIYRYLEQKGFQISKEELAQLKEYAKARGQNSSRLGQAFQEVQRVSESDLSDTTGTARMKAQLMSIGARKHTARNAFLTGADRAAAQIQTSNFGRRLDSGFIRAKVQGQKQLMGFKAQRKFADYQQSLAEKLTASGS